MTLEHDLLQLARDAMRSLMNGREFAVGQTGHYLNIISRIEAELSRPEKTQQWGNPKYLIEEAVLSEREACAVLCDEQQQKYLQAWRGVGDFQKSAMKNAPWTEGLADGASECAEMIRARSKK